MNNQKICEICFKVCHINHKKIHYKNFNEFTFRDMYAIFSYAKQLNLIDQNIIFEKIKQVMNEELNEIKNCLTSIYKLNMVDFYINKYEKKIKDEFFLVQNYYSYFSNQKDTKFKISTINNNMSFEEFVKEIRKAKIKKRYLCLHCCKYYQNIKNHNFFISREKKIYGCKQLTFNLLNCKKEDTINFIIDIIKYEESSFEKTSILEIKNKLLEHINDGKFNISLNTEDEVLELYDNIKKYFLSDGRIANQFAKLNWIKKHQINNENKNNELNKEKKNNKIINIRNKKRNLNLLDVINGDLFVQAYNNYFLGKRKRVSLNKVKTKIKKNKNTNCKMNSDLTSTEYSIINSNNIPEKLENEIINIFNKYIFN